MRGRFATAVVLLGMAWWLWPVTPAPVPESVPVAPTERVARGPKPPTLRVRHRGPRQPPEQVEAEQVEPGPNVVHCAVPAEVIEMGGNGTARMPGLHGDLFLLTEIRDGWLTLDVPPDYAGQGVLSLPGWSPTTIEVGFRGCEVGPLQARASISGIVVASEGIEDDRIEIRGCGLFQRLDRDGGFYAEVDAEPCTLIATRQDGLFRMRSDPLYLEPLPGEDLLVELVLPPWRAAGVGTVLRQRRDGIYIQEVRPDTPSEVAGLRAGDRILALDGEDVADYAVWEFVDIALGPEGSEVVYTVDRAGEEVDIVMVRELID